MRDVHAARCRSFACASKRLGVKRICPSIAMRSSRARPCMYASRSIVGVSFGKQPSTRPVRQWIHAHGSLVRSRFCGAIRPTARLLDLSSYSQAGKSIHAARSIVGVSMASFTLSVRNPLLYWIYRHAAIVGDPCTRLIRSP